MTIDEILKAISLLPTRHVCITGGEPLLQAELDALLDLLKKKKYTVTLETNGSKSIESLSMRMNILISLDVKCPSSGMHDKMDFSNIKLLKKKDQLKFIIADQDDYEYAKKIIMEYQPECDIIMNPRDGVELRMIAENVLRDKLNVRVLLQLHKIIWDGEQRAK